MAGGPRGRTVAGSDQEKDMAVPASASDHDRPTETRGLIVADVMHRGVVSCPPGATLTEVARMMSEHRIHGVVVDGTRRDAGAEHTAWGLVSDLDVAEAAAAGLDDEPTAAQMAARPAVVVAPDDLLSDAAQLMYDYDVHQLIVVTAGARRPVGVLSTLDVAAAVAAGRA
jgi:CBS domain-containing protein